MLAGIPNGGDDIFGRLGSKDCERSGGELGSVV
jgi:hypothetical protein